MRFSGYFLIALAAILSGCGNSATKRDLSQEDKRVLAQLLDTDKEIEQIKRDVNQKFGAVEDSHRQLRAAINLLRSAQTEEERAEAGDNTERAMTLVDVRFAELKAYKTSQWSSNVSGSQR